MKKIILICFILNACAFSAEKTDYLLSALSNPRENIHSKGINGLIGLGEKAIHDVAILISDPNKDVRSRVATVLGGIGGNQAIKILNTMIDDKTEIVRSATALSLGEATLKKTSSESKNSAFNSLTKLLTDKKAMVRDSSAIALGLVQKAETIPVILKQIILEKKIKIYNQREQTASYNAIKSMDRTLSSIVTNNNNIEYLASIVETQNEEELTILLKKSMEACDPRLCLALKNIAVRENENLAILAVVSLSSNGDSRCIQTLVQIASKAKNHILRTRASKTLRVLTGHNAGFGQVWEIWWNKNKDAVRALYKRDGFISKCHNPSINLKEKMQNFSAEELMPIINGIIYGSPSWTSISYRLLKSDNPKKWIPFLLETMEKEPSEQKRIALLAILNDLNVGKEKLVKYYEFVKKTNSNIKNKKQTSFSEEAILELIIED